MPSKMEDLIGCTFGAYKVLSYSEEESLLSGRKYWSCARHGRVSRTFGRK